MYYICITITSNNKTSTIMENSERERDIKILNAISCLIDTLSYSQTYKNVLSKEVDEMLEIENIRIIHQQQENNKH